MASSHGRQASSSGNERPHPSMASIEAERDIETTTLNNAQPRSWHADFVFVSRKWIRQLLGNNPFKSSYLDLFKPIKDVRSRATLWAGILLAIAAGVPLPVIGYLFGKIIDSFPPQEQELRERLYELIGVACGYFLVTTGYTIAWGLTGERISRRFRESLVERLLGLEQAYFDINDPDITNLLTEKVEAIQIGTSEKVGIFIQSISYFIAAFVVGFILNAKLTGILFAAIIPLMTFIVVAGSSRISKYTKAASEYTEAAGRVAESAIHAVKVVQAFGMSDKLSEEHYRLLKLSAGCAVRKSISAAVMLGSVYFTAYSANALAFWEGSRLAAESGANSAGTIYAVVFLILDASFVVGQFGPFLGCFATAAAAGEKVYEILNEPVSDIDVYSKSGQAATEEDMKADITFRNVTFAYPARTTSRALDELNLVLKAGKMNAIVGTSGCGKSTLVSLLLRLYDISSGQLMLGDHDIKSFNVGSLRKYSALVDQDSILFSGSVLDNISHGLGDHSLSKEQVLERCTEAAKAANLNFVDYLPQGIHTRIGNGGYTQLSGGQTQRICLARALVKKPALLLLDEPTSALDTTSEGLIMDAVRKVAATGTTVVMVAHRLSTVMDSPNIVLMGAGKVIEQGNHEQLMQNDGAYKNLIQAQRLDDSDASSIEISPGSSSEELQEKAASFEETYVSSDSDTASPEVEKQETSSKKAGFWNLLFRCLRLAKPDSPLVIAGLAASIISGGIILGESVVFGNLVSILNNTESPNFRDRADFFSLMFFVLALIAFVSYSGSGSAFGIVSSHFVAKVQHVSLVSILRQDMQWFSGRSVSSLMSNLNSDAGQLACLSGVAIGTICTVAVSISGGIILAHAIAWKIAVVLLAAVPVMVLAGYVRLRVLALAESRHRSAYNDAASIAAEACRGIRTIASLGREKGVHEAYKEAVKEPYVKGIRFTLISNTLLALSFSITYFVYALAYWWGARQVRNGTYGQLEFFIVLPALLFSAQSAGQIFSLSPEMSRAGVAARNVFGLHDQKPSIVDGNVAKRVTSSSGSSTLTLEDKTKVFSGGSIEFKGVSLCYPSKPQHPALQNISLSIKPGEFVALVGPSGAGKSTILSLLQRFYDPTAGSVSLDGQDIRSIAVSQHRGRLGLVPQEPDLFPGSIAYNIGLGAAPSQSITQHDIEAICAKCGIHDFISSLPEGYATECGTNGSKLSGGQKQRIAVARALIREPEVLLLDEYTSALDAHSEKQIKAAVDGAAVGRTVIVVAHRLSTVQNADRIVVFDGGKVVEVGGHAELVAKGGLYAGMVKAQTLA